MNELKRAFSLLQQLSSSSKTPKQVWSSQREPYYGFQIKTPSCFAYKKLLYTSNTQTSVNPSIF